MSVQQFLKRISRSIVSYIPSPSLLTARRLKDFPLRLLGKPHEIDFEFFRNLELESPVVLDVGANRGQSIDSFKAVIKTPIIYAIEPNPILADFLRKHYPDVKVYNLGLGEITEHMELFIPRYGHTFWDTRASLSSDFANNFLNNKHFIWFNPKRSGIESFSVPIDTLDELKIKADILKIDAEGLEEKILLGGSITLNNNPMIILESPDDSTINLLNKIGYESFGFDGHHLTRGKGKLNTIFLSKEHHSKILNNFDM